MLPWLCARPLEDFHSTPLPSKVLKQIGAGSVPTGRPFLLFSSRSNPLNMRPLAFWVRCHYLYLIT